MSVIPVVFYLPAGLAKCSVGLKISRSACKQARTPGLKKNSNTKYFNFYNYYLQSYNYYLESCNDRGGHHFFPLHQKATGK